MAIVDNRRKINITIANIESPNYNLSDIVGRKFIFSYDLCDEDIENNLTGMDEKACWIKKEIIKLLKIQPKVSGREIKEIFNPNNNQESITVLLERYIDLTIGEILNINSINYPTKDAVIDSSGLKRYSYEQLNNASDNLAKSLIKLGVCKGDNVAVIMTNSSEHVISKYAIHKCGAVTVNISVYEKQNTIEKLLLNTDIAVIIMKAGYKNTENIDMLYNLCPELKNSVPGKLESGKFPLLKTVIIADSEDKYPGTLKFDDLICEGDSLSNDEIVARMNSISYMDVATIIHTSGSTGLPKGVMLTHDMVIENACCHLSALNISNEDTVCMPVPMFHAFGSIGVALTSILAGATITLIDRANCIKLLEILHRDKCNVLFGVPTLFIGLMNSIIEKNYDISKLNLKKCILAGSQCHEKMLNDITKILGVKNIAVMYGMTEASPGISNTSFDDADEIKLKTVGKVWAGIDIKFVDILTNKDLPYGEIGEICIKGYNVMKGYYKNPGMTNEAIDDNGYLHTGDIGFLRPDGNLSLVGRCKDIIIKNGENICPKDIEECLLTHEAIKEVYVVGAPDYKSGEIVVAFIKLKKGFTLTVEDVQKFCKGKIPNITIPSKIKIVDEFPTSPTGKILKKELSKMAIKIF